jgi:hypothetical protein
VLTEEDSKSGDRFKIRTPSLILVFKSSNSYAEY